MESGLGHGYAISQLRIKATVLGLGAKFGPSLLGHVPNAPGVLCKADSPFSERLQEGTTWFLYGLIKQKHVGKKTRERKEGRKEERKERPKASAAATAACPIGEFASSTGQHFCRLNEIKAS